MKKAFSILLCVFILLQGGILSFQYVFKLFQHKISVENGLEKGLFNDQLQLFTTTQLVNANWENDHEFFLEGAKYDVVKTSKLNGELLYTCINDEVEKILINDLEKSEKKSNLIEELIKKFNIQINTLVRFQISKPLEVNPLGFIFELGTYDFIFLRFINKPPIF